MTHVLHRLRLARRRVRRAVLRRRRLLAACLVLVSVWAGLRATVAPPPPLVPVVVAAHDLGAGAVLTPEDLDTVGFAPGSVPQGRLREAVGRRLAAPLRRGQPLTDTSVIGPGLVDLHPELVALPVRLPDTAMAELLRIGDRVDLIAADPQGGAAETVAHETVVLGLPPPPTDAGADGLPGRLVVLGVREADVAAVSSATVTHFLTIAWSH